MAGAYKLDLQSELGQRLAAAPENSWVQVNLNEYQSVWTPLDQRPKPSQAPSVGGPWSIIEAWGSMAWDSNRGSLILYGGGHANYPGNEIYRWLASDMRWERASLPSEVYLASGSTLFLPVDGPFNAPAAAHTYDSTEFLPLADRYITFGGASFNTGHYYELIDGRRTGPYLWDPSRAYPDAVGGTAGSQVKPATYPDVIGGQMWQNRDNLEPPSANEPRPGYYGTFMINGASAYAEENGKDVLYIQTSSELFRYTLHDIDDPTKDTYQRVGRYIRFPFTGQGAAGYDPYRKIFLRTADSTITYWSLTSPGDGNENRIVTPVVTSGTFPFDQLRQYGVDFDPVRRVFVLWGGQNQVWELRAPDDLELGTWTLSPRSPISATSPNLVGPHTGILGKWKYASGLDVFLGVYDPYKGQVWAYKPPNWSPNVVSPLPYLLSPRNGSSFVTGSDITVTADSVDRTINSIQAFANGTLIGSGFSVPFTFTWQDVPAGAYALHVRAVGGDGVERQSSAVSITVSGVTNAPPTVTLTSPASGASFVSGSNVSMSATAADSDGAIARVEFHANGVKLGEDATAPYAYTWVAPAVGTHVLTALAVDDEGATTVSNAVAVTVTAAPNVPPTISLTAPVAGSNFVSGANIVFAATASDSDGAIARVEFFANGAKLGEDVTAPHAYTWVAPPIGSHTLRAIAFDDDGASTATTDVTVTVTPASSGGQTITLQNGLGGYAGVTDTYMYEFHSAVNFGSRVYLQDATGSSRFRSILRFAIFNSEGGPVPDGATIASARLSLYKSTSYDHVYRLRPLLVDWTEMEATWLARRTGVAWGTPGATGIGTDLASTFDAQAAVGWNPGWLEFDVTTGVAAIAEGRANHGWLLEPVSGNSNLKQFHSSQYLTDPTLRPKLVVSYSMPGDANQPPTVNLTAPVDGASFTAGEAITLTADAADADGSIARVEFLANGVEIGEDTTAPYTYAWNEAPAGAPVLSARAIDDDGASTISTSVTITVIAAPNVAPTVTLTAPADGASFTTGETITLTADAADVDGSIARVEFLANGVEIGEDTTAPYTYAWNGAPAGSPVISARAIDDDGASTISTSVTITVIAAPNVAPTVTLTAPTNGSSFTTGETITLTADAADADGSIVRVEFLADGVEIGEDTTAPYTYAWSGAPVGSPVLSARAIDDDGASTTSATVTITVTQSSGQPQTVTLQEGLDGYTGTRDTYLYQYHSNNNFGNRQALLDQTGIRPFRTLLRFAIFRSEGGPVPDGATITSARLSLYKSTSYDHVYRLRPLLVDWVENQATWNLSRTGVPWSAAGASAIGADLAADHDAQASIAWSPGWIEFDVTAGVQAMVTGRSNWGWLLEPVSGNSNLKEFYSSEYSKDPTLRPKLIVTYQN